MDNNERFSRIEEVLADVLIEMHGMNTRIEALQQGQQQMIGIFNRFAEAVVTKMDEQTAIMNRQAARMDEQALKMDQQMARMDAQTARLDAQAAKMDEQTAELKGMREDIKLLYNHEERLRKVEAAVFQKRT